MPKPKSNVVRMKIPPTMYVTLFKPLAEPIEAIPSPFGECKSTSTISKSAEII